MSFQYEQRNFIISLLRGEVEINDPELCRSTPAISGNILLAYLKIGSPLGIDPMLPFFRPMFNKEGEDLVSMIDETTSNMLADLIDENPELMGELFYKLVFDVNLSNTKIMNVLSGSSTYFHLRLKQEKIKKFFRAMGTMFSNFILPLLNLTLVEFRGPLKVSDSSGLVMVDQGPMTPSVASALLMLGMVSKESADNPFCIQTLNTCWTRGLDLKVDSMVMHLLDNMDVTAELMKFTRELCDVDTEYVPVLANQISKISGFSR